MRKYFGTDKNYFHKNGILRLNFNSDEEWIKLLSKYFKFIETNNFILTEGENKYPCRMFVLKNDWGYFLGERW